MCSAGVVAAGSIPALVQLAESSSSLPMQQEAALALCRLALISTAILEDFQAARGIPAVLHASSSSGSSQGLRQAAAMLRYGLSGGSHDGTGNNG